MAVYWVGSGVFTHRGKDHMPGEEVKGLDKKQADQMVKKGTLAEEAPRTGRPPSEVSQLREQVADLTAKLKEATSVDAAVELRRELDDLTTERDELRVKLSAMEKAVEELTDQLTAVRKEAADVTAAAGPKGGKKA